MGRGSGAGFKHPLTSDLGILDSISLKFKVFRHFLEFESLDFLDFVYYGRQAWYFTGKSQKVVEKKI